MTVPADIRNLAAGQIVELFELDTTVAGGSVMRFHNGVNGLGNDVTWQGNVYTRFPIEATGFEFSGRGQMPRPTLRVANINGLLGALVRTYQDLLGSKLTRRRTLAKYLDAVNFPAQRNLLTYTEQFDQWTQQNATVAANSIADPIGGTTADKIVESNVSGVTHFLSRVMTRTASGGSQITFSIYLKSAERSQWMIRFMAGGAITPTTKYGVFDTNAGTANGTNLATQTIASIGNGWYRCSVTATADVTGTVTAAAFLMVAGNNTYAGDGVSGAYVWGAQLEVGSTPTDYQPVGATFQQNPTADPTAALPDDVYFIDRKTTESKVIIEFELSAAFDVAGVQLPRRYIVQNVCQWQYRGPECGYTGTAYFDANDQAVGALAQDVCGKRLSSCKCRFGQYAELPYGGFPAAGLIR